jgi:hypothetical protein
MVPTNSMFRLFFDTLQSGVKVKYTILDDNKEIVYTTSHQEPFIEGDVMVELLGQTEHH